MALKIDPSERYEGNDGSWSTFAVNIGTPPQQMRVLPATSESAIYVVLGQGCPNTTTQSDCQDKRGVLFNPASTNDASWSPQHASDNSQYFRLPFVSETALPGYNNTNGAYSSPLSYPARQHRLSQAVVRDIFYFSIKEVGLDALTLQSNGSVYPPHPLLNQVIAGFAATVPWLGLLGLSGRPSHLTTVSTSQLSPLQSLLANGSIYGMYWAYTAGAAYNQALGSLTFGGYDAARVDMDSALKVPFDANSDHDLRVTVNTITITSGTTSNVQGMPITAVIDSVVPEIWLPADACDQFESAFGLVWNSTYSMYLVNETQHTNMVNMDASVTFFLAAAIGETSPVHVTLPYAAFDLTAQYPLAGISDFQGTQRYFPLKRANDPSQYFLGRTFLQEAYVTADYNTSTFTVGPAMFPPRTSTTNITVVYPAPHHRTTSALSAGAIAGIAIGAVAVIALLAGLGFWLWRRKNKKTKALQKRDTGVYSMRTASLDNTTIVGEFDGVDRDRVEFYKPNFSPPVDHNEGGDYFKPELDARATAVSPSGNQRYELYAGSVRRPYHIRNMSDSSQGSGVSPVTNQRFSNIMGEPSPSFDQPSPPMHPSGSPTPPHSRHHSGTTQQEIYEMAERGG